MNYTQSNEWGWGTCLQGYLESPVTANQIIAVFGPGLGESDKTQYEWRFDDDEGGVWTVYDWKNYGGLDPDTAYDWHIGGFHGRVEGYQKFRKWFLEKVGGCPRCGSTEPPVVSTLKPEYGCCASERSR